MSKMEILSYIGVCFLAVGHLNISTISVINRSLTTSAKRAMPLVLGISVGFGCVSFVAIASLAYLSHLSPISYKVVSVVGATYLSYVGFKQFSHSEKTFPLGDSGKIEKDMNAFAQGFIILVFVHEPLYFFISIFPIYVKPSLNIESFIIYPIILVAISLLIHTIYSFLSVKIVNFIKIAHPFIHKSAGGLFFLLSFMSLVSTFK